MALTEFVKRPQVGAKGMVYARVEADGSVKSSVDKFYTQETLQQMKEAFGAKPGDLILILSGDNAMKTRKQLCELRLEVASQLGLRDKNKFACLWVVDFPLFEWSEEDQRFYAMHHPSLLRSRKIFRCWIAIRVPYVLMLTIWLSMVLKWVEVLSVSMTANCRIRCFSCWDSPKKEHSLVQAS